MNEREENECYDRTVRTVVDDSSLSNQVEMRDVRRLRVYVLESAFLVLSFDTLNPFVSFFPVSSVPTPFVNDLLSALNNESALGGVGGRSISGGGPGSNFSASELCSCK